MEVSGSRPSTVRILIEERSQVGEGRRAASGLIRDLPFDEAARGNVALVATELAANLVAHAGRGELLLNLFGEDGTAGIEIIAIDQGPGIKDIARSTADGYSTAGTPGNGFGAVMRLSGDFDIYSPPNGGLIVLSRIYARTLPARRIGAHGLSTPMQGETICGDAWVAAPTPEGIRIAIADGLGHGPLARESADLAITAFHDSLRNDIDTVLQRAHNSVYGTRGCVFAVAEINSDENRLAYCGIGNISASTLSGMTTQAMVAMNGTVGSTSHKPRTFTYPWTGQAILVMHSDGMQSNWSLDSYKGVLAHDLTVIAAVLYRDFNRRRDDFTVVVARQEPVD